MPRVLQFVACHGPAIDGRAVFCPRFPVLGGAMGIRGTGKVATGVAPETMQKRLRAWGIDAGQCIVIVDQGGT